MKILHDGAQTLTGKVGRLPGERTANASSRRAEPSQSAARYARVRPLPADVIGKKHWVVGFRHGDPKARLGADAVRRSVDWKRFRNRPGHKYGSVSPGTPIAHNASSPWACAGAVDQSRLSARPSWRIAAWMASTRRGGAGMGASVRRPIPLPMMDGFGPEYWTGTQATPWP